MVLHECGAQFFYLQAFKFLSNPSPKKYVHQKDQPRCKLFAAIIVTHGLYSPPCLTTDFWPINLVDTDAYFSSHRKLQVRGALGQEKRANIKHEYFLFYSRVRGILTHLSCKSRQNYSLLDLRPLYYPRQENKVCLVWGFCFVFFGCSLFQDS